MPLVTGVSNISYPNLCFHTVSSCRAGAIHRARMWAGAEVERPCRDSEAARSQTRLQALIFWLRDPDYLADELLDESEVGARDDALRSCGRFTTSASLTCAGCRWLPTCSGRTIRRSRSCTRCSTTKGSTTRSWAASTSLARGRGPSARRLDITTFESPGAWRLARCGLAGRERSPSAAAP
jgi:hypothetical protein